MDPAEVDALLDLAGVGPEQLAAHAMRQLHEQPDLPVVERVALAITVCTNGRAENNATVGQVAEVAGCSISDVHQGILAMVDRAGAHPG